MAFARSSFSHKSPLSSALNSPVLSQTLKCLGPPTYLRSWQPSSSSSPSTWLSRTNVAKRRELDPSPTPWWTMDSILTESFLASASTTASTQSPGHRAQSFAFRKVFKPSMLHMTCKIMYFSNLFKKIMGYFLLAIQR